MTGNVYAIVGGRDGVGATTTAVALGSSLAEQSRRVAVIDADFEDEGVGAALDLGEPDLTLRDVLRGDADLDDALVETAHGLRVLPSGDAAPAPTDVRSHALVRAADRVRERFDDVLVDLGAAGGTPAAIALERADGALLTATPQDDAIAGVADAATVTRYHGADVLGTVFTTISEGAEVDHEAAAEAIGTDVLAMVPEDDAVAESAETGTSLLRHDPDSSAAMVYWELASRLAAGDLGDDPVVHEQPIGGTDERSSATAAEQDTEAQRASSPASQAQQNADEHNSSSPDSASPRRDAEAQRASSPASTSSRQDAAEQSSANPDSASPRRDAEAQRASSPASTSSRQDAAEQSSANPDSASPRRDAEAQRASSPASTSSRQDAEATGEPRAPDQPSQAQDDADPRAQPADAAASDGTPAETVAADDGESAADDAAAQPSERTSRNEFSWDEDSADGDSSAADSSDDDGDEGVPDDDGSALNDDEDAPTDDEDADFGTADDGARAMGAPVDAETADVTDEQNGEREATAGVADDPSDGVETDALDDEVDAVDHEHENAAGEDDGAVADEDDEDEIEAAFKATMDNVREQRENEDSDDGDEAVDGDADDDDGGMFGIGN
ncbi:AAA family ATPase [Natronoarchaeum rubrum]|uniref:AAA family ATPase n=1 Tax=Natronoarchaeum rubrum TaxID=755311 RepID=UPI0021124497|nr:AAA family ATPase [Natronoarchaeum rubrum]